MQTVAYSISKLNITLNYCGQTHIIDRTSHLAEQIIQALKDKNYDLLPSLISDAQKVADFSNGLFVLKDGQVLINNEPVHSVLAEKILEFAKEGLPYEPLVKFAKNVNLNPSYRAQTDLFAFLDKNNHPITEDGNFIAYKKVKDDFKDVHSGTIDNSPGKVVSMPRNKVNEDPDQTCSFGLHAANFDYASNFYGGGKMIELEINPKDVVAIPVDYNQSKMRVCEYKVLGVVDQKLSTTTLRKKDTPLNSYTNDSQVSSYDTNTDDGQNYDDDEDDEDDDEDDDDGYPLTHDEEYY